MYTEQLSYIFYLIIQLFFNFIGKNSFLLQPKFKNNMEAEKVVKMAMREYQKKGECGESSDMRRGQLMLMFGPKEKSEREDFGA